MISTAKRSKIWNKFSRSCGINSRSNLRSLQLRKLRAH